jgi:CheY-like chemotaxis protein
MAPIDLAHRRPRAPLSAPANADVADIAAQVGSEVAGALSTALERVNALATTGRIDRASLRALREEIELARRVGMKAQQASRLAAGEVPQAHEPLDLTVMLREALLQRGREIEARGITVRQRLRAAGVIGDATLIYALLHGLLDWAFEHARSAIEIDLGHRNWPAQARLACRFALRAEDEIPTTGSATAEPMLDTVAWRLLHLTAQALALPIERETDGEGRLTLALEFPRTIADAPRALAALDLGPGGAPTSNTRALAGSHVLVVAARREVRKLVREGLRTQGLMIDFVTSVDEAREFCRSGMPHALVHEAALGGEAFERLRSELLAEVPMLAFVQITEDGKGFDVRQHGGRDAVCVARGAIVESLPSALMFELARCS